MPRILHAGPLSLRYENGEIAALKLGEIEVLRRVHALVRDRNWGTVAPHILNEEVLDGGDHFRVVFQARHEQSEISFEWRGAIEGGRDGTIQFSFDGAAKTSFWRNRIGFCVLHPMSCAGAAVALQHCDDSRETSAFPLEIAPHCPFRNVRALSHRIAPELWAKVEFEGEVFETEDQRNWTDASFKTYCTPLELPFPIRIETGERVWQRVTLHFKGDFPHLNTTEAQAAVRVNLGPPLHVLPPIGLALAPDTTPLDARALALLRELHLAHVRVDVDLTRDFRSQIERAVENTNALGCALEAALFVDETLDEEALESAISLFKAARVSSFALFQNQTETVSSAVFDQAKARLQAAFAGVPVGAGSNANFAEFNRQRPPQRADYAIYAANPQVHAFDDASVLETPAALGQTLQSARSIVGQKAVKISPLTLKPRFNAVATAPTQDAPILPDARPKNADARQSSPLCAAWTLASLAALLGCGLGTIEGDSLTLFETIGWRGVLDENGAPTLTWFLLRDLARARAETAFSVMSSDESRVVGLSLGNDIWLTNLSAQPQEVALDGAAKAAKRAELQTLATTQWHHIHAQDDVLRWKMGAYEVVRVQPTIEMFEKPDGWV